jgi:hypothetical protein
MSEFRDKANIRTQGLKEVLTSLEKERDTLLDEIANRRGRVEFAEKIIRSIYEKVLDINKEEQAKELELIKIQAEKQRQEFEKAKVGIKTPKIQKGK